MTKPPTRGPDLAPRDCLLFILGSGLNSAGDWYLYPGYPYVYLSISLHSIVPPWIPPDIHSSSPSPIGASFKAQPSRPKQPITHSVTSSAASATLCLRPRDGERLTSCRRRMPTARESVQDSMMAALPFVPSLGSGCWLTRRTGMRIAFNATSGFLLESPRKRVCDLSVATSATLTG